MSGRKKQETYIQSLEGMTRKHSQWRDVMHRLFKNRLAIVGLILVAAVLFATIFANFLTPYDYSAQSFGDRFVYPCLAHPFGTDQYGRDLLARILYGGRVSLIVALIAVVISLLLGGIIGACCGIYGSRFDSIVMRLCDVLNCVPGLLFALAVVAALGSSMRNLLIAVTIVSLPGFIRIVRSVILSIVEQEYIMAARACDSSNFTIIMRHILPNAMGPIIIQASMSVASMMLTAAGLSFIGMGVQPPTPEWGVMLSTARDYMKTAPYLLLFPGIAIALSALALNLVGDGLRDALDPKMKV